MNEFEENNENKRNAYFSTAKNNRGNELRKALAPFSKSKDRENVRSIQHEKTSSNKSLEKYVIDNKSVSNRSNHSTIYEHIMGFNKDNSTQENVSKFLNIHDKIEEQIIDQRLESEERLKESIAPINSENRVRESPLFNRKEINVPYKMQKIEEEEKSSMQSVDGLK